MIWENIGDDGKYHHSIWFAQHSNGPSAWVPPIEVKFSASTLEGLLARRREIINNKLKRLKKE